MTLGRALGFSEDLIDTIKGDYLGSEFFTAAEKAAMNWAEVLTLKQYHGSPGNPPKSEEVMATLKKYYDEAQIVELTMVSGFFNFWNRFTDGLQIDIEGDLTMNLFAKSTTVNPTDYISYMRDCWWNAP